MCLGLSVPFNDGGEGCGGCRAAGGGAPRHPKAPDPAATAIAGLPDPRLASRFCGPSTGRWRLTSTARRNWSRFEPICRSDSIIATGWPLRGYDSFSYKYHLALLVDQNHSFWPSWVCTRARRRPPGKKRCWGSLTRWLFPPAICELALPFGNLSSGEQYACLKCRL
jgi:hypothetical protein